MTIKKEHWYLGAFVLGIAIYLITKPKDGVLSSAEINSTNENMNFTGVDDSYADMAEKNVFPSIPTINLNNLTK
jgi:hypothetical protein